MDSLNSPAGLYGRGFNDHSALLGALPTDQQQPQIPTGSVIAKAVAPLLDPSGQPQSTVPPSPIQLNPELAAPQVMSMPVPQVQTQSDITPQTQTIAGGMGQAPSTYGKDSVTLPAADTGDSAPGPTVNSAIADGLPGLGKALVGDGNGGGLFGGAVNMVKKMFGLGADDAGPGTNLASSSGNAGPSSDQSNLTPFFTNWTASRSTGPVGSENMDNSMW